MIYHGKTVHCSECGSENMRFVRLAIPDVLIECNQCGTGTLGSEFDEWKDDWKKLVKPHESNHPSLFRSILAIFCPRGLTKKGGKE